MYNAPSYPHTITDGHGEEMTFLRRYEDAERGTVLQIESTTYPDQGPPMHSHIQQHERITVTKGRAGLEAGDGTVTYAEAGDTVHFAPGEAHRFWNAGDEPLEMTGEIWPAGNFEWFITQMFESTRSTGKGRPRPFDAAFLTHRYRSEFETLVVPAPVRKVVFPAIVAVGSAFGLSRRFADAPAPLAS